MNFIKVCERDGVGLFFLNRTASLSLSVRCAKKIKEKEAMSERLASLLFSPCVREGKDEIRERKRRKYCVLLYFRFLSLRLFRRDTLFVTPHREKGQKDRLGANEKSVPA
jgi:hypothetical protein